MVRAARNARERVALRAARPFSIRRVALAPSLLLIGFLFGCDSGPSEDKIRSDLNLIVGGKSRHVLRVGTISVENREEIADDLWQYQVEARLEAAGVEGKNDGRIPLGSPKNSGLLAFDGQTLTLVLQYLKIGGEWSLARVEDGRQSPGEAR